MPIISGMLGPVMSASRSPTLAPSIASATARFTDTVLLPTPPLPEATAMMFLTPGTSAGAAPAVARRTIAPQVTVDRAARPSAAELGVDVLLDLVLERARRRGQLDLERHVRVAPIVTSLTMLSVTMSRPSSGSWTFLSAS